MDFKYRLIFFLIVLLWYVGIFGEFLTQIWHSSAFALPFLQIIYSHVCHQDPAKVIYFNGAKTFVCARCLGIYTGILIVTFYFLFKANLKKGPVKVLIFGFLPVAADVFLVKIGAYSYSKTIAFLSGFILGSIGIYYFYEIISSKITKDKN